MHDVVSYKLVILRAFLFAGVWCVSSISMSADLPAGWPWRGVNVIEEIDGFSPAQLVTILPDKGVSSISIRMLPRKRAKDGGLTPRDAWKQSLDWAVEILDECKKLGIFATIVLEAGFPLDPLIGYNQTSPKFWNNPKDRGDVISLASDLSKRFASRGAELVAYHVMGEPVMIVDGKSLAPPQWKLFIGELIGEMRRNDPKRWVAVTPPPWASPTNYRNFSPLPFPRIIYNAHMFKPHAYTHQGIKNHQKRFEYPGVINGKRWDRKQLVSVFSMLRDFQLKHNVPIWIGSFSAVRWAEGAEQYIKDVVSISNEYGWSWSYFAINGWNGWNPRYNSEYCCLPSMHSRVISKQNVGVSSRRWGTLKQIFESSSTGQPSAKASGFE